MSYNIGSVEYLTDGRLTIAKKTRRALARKIEVPECCFLEDDDDVADGPSADEVTITRLSWYGEGSGNAFEDLKDKVLPKTKGCADLLFTWEDGDSHTGLRVEDGKVTECDVVMTLRPVAEAA